MRDLDGDGEPEVLLDLYTGGVHCCSNTLIFHLDRGIYWPVDGWWGNYHYSLRDYDRDKRPELVTVDDRFAYAFAPFAVTVPPIRIWHFDRGRLIDVTREFPEVVFKDARVILLIYEQARKLKFREVRGCSPATWRLSTCLDGSSKAGASSSVPTAAASSGVTERKTRGRPDGRICARCERSCGRPGMPGETTVKFSPPRPS